MFRSLLLSSALLASCATQPAATSEEDSKRKLAALLEKFDRFDYNGNGSLTRQEIRQGLEESTVEGVSEEDIERAFAVIDRNRNGSISLAEANAAEQRELGHEH